MSARNVRLVLTPLTRQDLRDILQYTAQTWGRERRDAYQALVLGRLRELTAYPNLGRARDEVFPGCRSLRVEQHVAYYRTTDAEIIVARLLHARQDAVGIVSEPTAPAQP